MKVKDCFEYMTGEEADFDPGYDTDPADLEELREADDNIEEIEKFFKEQLKAQGYEEFFE